ncbi:hypothetical protein GQ600_17042 [Phytophthora cactorum]|nr:hypothetical protein GQ600_17042 [Phytophthora cactorum]
MVVQHSTRVGVGLLRGPDGASFSELGFGVPPSTLARVFNTAEEAMAAALRGFEPARIVWPTVERQRALTRLIAQREPLLHFTWAS